MATRARLRGLGLRRAVLYDFPLLNAVVAWAFALAVLVMIIFAHGARRKLGGTFFGFALVLAWWITLKPSNNRGWQPDVAQTAWAEVKGDEVTLHNVRNCDYRTEADYTPRWETRTVRVSQITGVDLAINYWGSPWMAHPIASFQFADAPPVCFSIETRKEIGESYSAIGGLYRQFELIYIVADERDVIRVRTNYRRGEDIYLYRIPLHPLKPASASTNTCVRSTKSTTARAGITPSLPTARPPSATSTPLRNECLGTGASYSMAKATNSCSSAIRSPPTACPSQS